MEDNIKIEFLSEKTSLLSPDIIVTYLSLTYITPFGDRESFPVTQIRFEGWPDFGVPSHPDTLLTLIDIYRTELLLTQEKYIGTPGPPIIHCSAGVGRTGTFCAIDSALYLLESWPEEPDLVVHIVNTFRQQRMLTVQSYPQFCFVYKVLNYFTSCRPRKLDM
ncbi:tyrosine protein phosphatase 1 [Massospora cicadina]|nr:tyrosine protein phosphatase 1 [Massospora cicadina]